MAQLSDYQRDVLIRTALGEARGEGVEGMADVLQVIFNRANSGQFPSDPAAVALQDKQFSTWNKGEGGNNPQQFRPSDPIYKSAERALDAVLGGRPDPTGGALFYHTPAVNPYWAKSVNKHGTIERNGHIFYANRPTPPAEVPNVVATQTDTQRPQQVQSRSSTPTSTASRQVPTNWFTPRLAPGNDDIYSYHIPDQTPTTVVGGLGSLTPDRAPPPLPRPRPGMPVVPYEQGRTVATVATPQPQRLPPLPPSNLAPANLVRTTMDRASSAVDPGLQRALEQRSQRPMIETSMQRTAAAVDPGLQRALEASGVGRPPATRSVASVPAPASPAMGITTDRGAMPTRSAFLSEFGLANPRETLAAPLPTTAVPGPNNFAKGNERLLPPPRVQIAGLDAVPSAVPTVGTALDVVPNAGFPPMPRPRPVPFSMPTPMGQRPTLPMPRANPFAMPTPVAQRPNPNALRVTVNGAGSYNAPQRAPTPTREQMLAAIRARSRGPTAFGHGGTIDGAVQPIGTLSGRR